MRKILKAVATSVTHSFFVFLTRRHDLFVSSNFLIDASAASNSGLASNRFMFVLYRSRRVARKLVCFLFCCLVFFFGVFFGGQQFFGGATFFLYVKNNNPSHHATQTCVGNKVLSNGRSFILAVTYLFSIILFHV